MARRSRADEWTNPEQHLRTQHSRREAGSQSHGTPPESAEPPRDVKRARGPLGDHSKETLLEFLVEVVLMTNLNSRVARIVAGLAVVSAFAVAPMAAQAADTNATGTLGAGELTNTAPAIRSARRDADRCRADRRTPTSAPGASRTRRAATAGYSITVAAPRRPWTRRRRRGSPGDRRLADADRHATAGRRRPNAKPSQVRRPAGTTSCSATPQRRSRTPRPARAGRVGVPRTVADGLQVVIPGDATGRRVQQHADLHAALRCV